MTAVLDESDDDLLDDADYTGITPSCSSRAAAGMTRHLAAVDCGDGFRESFLVLFLQSSACLTASWEHTHVWLSGANADASHVLYPFLLSFPDSYIDHQ